MTTIFALSTAYVKSAVAIVRVSGENAFTSLKALTNNNSIPNKPALRVIYNNNQTAIDEALVLCFKNPNSYTGQNVVEYHIHGGLGVIKELIKALSSQPNHRLALPGEFTKLALLNNKINLLKAEAINDLINAKTITQIQQSMFHLQNHALSKYTNYLNSIKYVLALTEATIDFSDQDIPDTLFTEIDQKIDEIINQISAEQQKTTGVKKLKEGLKIAIIGKPNTGKSSLINIITQKDTAIVSNIAGTTRDVIEVDLDFNGYPISIADTAGIRETTDEIEQEGVKRAINKTNNSDIKIAMFDINNINQEDKAIIKLANPQTLVILNKTDLLQSNPDTIANNLCKQNSNININNVICTALSNANNNSVVINHLHNAIKQAYGNIENPIITNDRHIAIINQAKENLTNAKQNKHDMVILAFYLREALNNIGLIMGKTNTEQILDVIFSKFCIGK